MAIPQVAFGQYQNAGYAGLIADDAFHDVMSYSAGTGTIAFGLPVTLGANPERQVKPVTTATGQGALCVGIAAASLTVESAFPQAGTSAYAITDTVPVFKRGRIWMQTNDAVVAGAAANLVLANGTVTDEVVAAGIEAFTQFKATFITGTTAAGLAVVEID